MHISNRFWVRVVMAGRCNPACLWASTTSTPDTAEQFGRKMRRPRPVTGGRRRPLSCRVYFDIAGPDHQNSFAARRSTNSYLPPAPLFAPPSSTICAALPFSSGTWVNGRSKPILTPSPAIGVMARRDHRPPRAHPDGIARNTAMGDRQGDSLQE